MKEIQVAKLIFHSSLSVMKKILDLEAYRIGKKSDEYNYFRKQVMDNIYQGLQKLFKQLETENIIQRCPKKCNLRQGYNPCDCGGSGYINV
ncbi:MAG: hypothetical protein JW924_03430 [Fusobacteriaceae bacterium]|nr:hypothetical protein [Fusobacteriaceae bacterium]